MERNHLGDFELMVVAASLHLGEQAYGARIRQEIEERTGRDIALGAVYKALARLESKELVSSRLGSPRPERGGRSRRNYEVTAKGRDRFAESLHALRGMLAGLNLDWVPR
ncbi:MAG: helix-turn-helix transcriptional regulator [Thermoanaerobaculia bacterium]|nr:helix-turn-helix transcriptional regulator [Thermoanaerobaculia bacterium]